MAAPYNENPTPVRCYAGDQIFTFLARRRRRRIIKVVGICAVLISALLNSVGCRTDRFKDGEFSDLTEVSMRRMSQIRSKSRKTALYTGGKKLATAHILEGPHPLDDYIQFSLVQNQEILAARKQVESLVSRVRVARSLSDPNLTAISQPAPVQTAAGEFQFILNANQKFPWFGKLNARGLVADAEVGIARSELEAVERETIAKVKNCLLYTSPSPRDGLLSRMPSSA